MISEIFCPKSAPISVNKEIGGEDLVVGEKRVFENGWGHRRGFVVYIVHKILIPSISNNQVSDRPCLFPGEVCGGPSRVAVLGDTTRSISISYNMSLSVQFQ